MDALLRVLFAPAAFWHKAIDRLAKQRWMPALSEARTQAGDLRSLIAKNPDQMLANLAESWRDRETNVANALENGSRPTTVKVSVGSAGGFSSEQRVRHSHFGKGVITDVADSGDERQISILFDSEEQKTFLLSLVADKLEILTESDA